MKDKRRELYIELEQMRDSKVLSYFTSTRQGMETVIASDAVDLFAEQLDAIGPTKRISLFLYTTGGSTSASWNITNLLLMFCDELEVIVPSLARSGGTLICLGAKQIIMTKQATLGPIDPSINLPLNPQIPNAGPQARAPVSVEAIRGYLELAKNEMGIRDDIGLSNVLIKLSDMVHPLVLGEAMRIRSQIQMLAEKLLKEHVKDSETVKNIISFLCSDSGSHDYTINRREAHELGLDIVKPSQEEYLTIKALYSDIRNEMLMNTPYDPKTILGTNTFVDYAYKRASIESLHGGSDYFISEGKLTRIQVQNQPGTPPQIAVSDQRTFEGWKHENA